MDSDFDVLAKKESTGGVGGGGGATFSGGQ